MQLVFIILLTIFQADKMTPEQVVQKQLETYNARNLEGFMSTMASDVALYNYKDGEQLASGFSAVKAMYANLFKSSPKLNSMLTNRIVLGNQVIDHETITGRMGNEAPIELVVIFEVKAEKIFKITVLRNND